MRDGVNDDDREHEEPISVPGGWKAIFRFTKRPHFVAAVPAIFFAAAGGALGPVMAIFLGRFFDAFADYGAGKISPDILIHQTLKSVYALLGLGIGSIFLNGGLFMAWLSFGEMQAKSVRDGLFQTLLHKDLEWFEMRESGVGSLLTRLQTQIRQLQLGTSQPMGFCVSLVVEGFVALGLSFSYGPKLTLVILATLPASAVLLHFISRDLQGNIEKQADALTEASRTAHNAVTHISLLKYFNTQSQESRVYSNQIRTAALYSLKQVRATALQAGFIKFISTTMFVQGFWYGSVLVHNGSMSAGKVITVFWSTLMAVQAFQGILPHILVLATAQAAAVALKSVIDTVNRGKMFTAQVGLRSPDFCDGDIQIKDVSFAYPARPDHLALQPSTFFFPAGETTFVVGRSGSGKSTVGSLLVRFYRPNTGRIIIDGHNLEGLSTTWLRNNITLVQQQNILFNESIFRNIAFGHQYHETLTHGQVAAGLELAALQTTVSSLPQGINTKVGANGSSLSGGQKQRVAIARARLRDTPVLILDESTSALDYVSRTSVMSAIREWRDHRTTIVITHDMTQIQENDFVYVLKDGKIFAEGFRRDIEKELNADLADDLLQPEPDFGPFNNEDDNVASVHVPDRSRARKAKEEDHQHMHQRQRRDSLEHQVNEITVRGTLRADPSVRRIERLSRYLGGRLSPTADTAMELPPPLPGHELWSKAVSEPAKSDEDRQIRAEPNLPLPRISIRPMSMHQSIVLQDMPCSRETGKPLPSPRLMDKLDVLRRLSLRRKSGFTEIHDPPSSQLSIKEILSTVWPLLGGKGKVQLILGFVAAAVQAAVPPVFSFVLTKLFQTFYDPVNYKHKAMIYSLSLLGVASADGLATFFGKLFMEFCARQWVDILRIEAMMRVVEQPRAWFDDTSNSSAYLTSALDRNAEEMRNLISRFATLIFIVIVMMTMSSIWAMVKCWKLTLVAFSVAPAVYGLTKAYNMMSSKWEARLNTANDEIGDIFGETFSDIRTVRTLTLESYFHQKYNQASAAAFSVGLHRAGYCGILYGLSASSIDFIIALVFYYGAYLAKTRAFSVSDILYAFSLITFSTAAANGIISFMPQLASSVDTGSYLLRLSRLSLDSHEFKGDVKPDPSSPTALMGSIQFHHLTFYYPTRPGRPVLYNLKFEIPPRLCTAIVGSSGSGKSTIAALLLKLYPPTADFLHDGPVDQDNGPISLRVCGEDIRSLNTTTLRGMIAIVPQTPALFSGSVRENICYGLSPMSRLRAMEKVQIAAKQAGVHDFIMSLPSQYETIIGEGGLGVSGGQAQRLVIARALVRRPKVLILDEPTSALDGESANIVKQSIQDLVGRSKETASAKVFDGKGPRGGMTVIVITHAKEMMEFADNIVMLQNGSVVEEGTYEGLLAKKGKLWEMLRAGGVAG